MKAFNVNKIRLLLGFLVIFSFFACDKEEYNRDSNTKLEFSTDTIMFDTVFTTIGSSTRELMIYNTHNENIVISNINLLGGDNSPFSINVDGVSGRSFNDVEISPGDSLYLFAKVRIDPNNSNNPFVEEDEILFVTNGNLQKIKLLAWGQNANYIIAKDTVGSLVLNIIARENEVAHWTSERPYVIIGGYAAVDSLGTLIIDPGTHVYFHKGCGLWIYRYGNIQVNGTFGNEVIFDSDRLEPEYDNVSGMWDRIWINEGPIRNEIHHAVIRNGFIGIQAESLSLSEYWSDNLLLENVRIENMSGMGIYSVLYSINAGNILVDDCGSYLVALTLGGEYDFRNCTFANFWRSSARQVQSVYVNNYFVDENENPIPINVNSYFFGNCIMYGNQNNEVFLDGKGTFNCSLKNCLVKVAKEEEANISSYLEDCIINKSPMFRDSLNFDYHIDTIISPVINAGSIEVVTNSPVEIGTDLDNISRIGQGGMDKPEIGVYQFKEE